MKPRQLTELYERLEPYLADVDSEEGQDEIYSDSSHVRLLWEDGEMNVTKSGDLFGSRRLHLVQEPWLPRNQVLWHPPEGQDHQKKIVLDSDRVDEILREYAEENNLTFPRP